MPMGSSRAAAEPDSYSDPSNIDCCQSDIRGRREILHRNASSNATRGRRIKWTRPGDLNAYDEDVEEHLAHRVGGVVDLAAERQSDALFRQFVSDGTCVGNGAGESVEFRYNERVAGSDCGESLIQPGALAVGAGEPVIEVDPICGYDEDRRGILSEMSLGGPCRGVPRRRRAKEH